MIAEESLRTNQTSGAVVSSPGCTQESPGELWGKKDSQAISQTNKVGTSRGGTQASVMFNTPQVIPRRRQWHPTPVCLLENPMDGGAWWAAVHGVSKSWTRLSDFTFTFHLHALEKATHSSVLAWRIPGTGEPGGLPSMGSHRVGHD